MSANFYKGTNSRGEARIPRFRPRSLPRVWLGSGPGQAKEARGGVPSKVEDESGAEADEF